MSSLAIFFAGAFAGGAVIFLIMTFIFAATKDD